EAAYAQWAVELGERAFAGFARGSRSGEVVGLCWKMSTDLSRPLVPAMGAHDALDGFITFRQARHAQMRLGEGAATARGGSIESLSLICRHRVWTTEDPLSLCRLLFDSG